jgi:hypothetical protein
MAQDNSAVDVDCSALMNPASWSVAQVCSWTKKKQQAAATVRAFAENEIDGDTLLKLTASDLREELGIKNLASRRRLLLDISVLQGFARLHEDRFNSNLFKCEVNSLSAAKEGMVGDVAAMQMDEIRLFEARAMDHEEAAKLQNRFNFLLQVEELDAKIALTIDNVNDQPAADHLNVFQCFSKQEGATRGV